MLMKLASVSAPPVPEPVLARAMDLVAAKPVSSSLPSWRWALPVAAAVCLALAIIPRQDRDPISTPAHPPMLSVPQQPVVRQMPAPAAAPVIEFPHEGATVSPRDLEFRWSAQEGVLYYGVRVLTADGSLVLEKQVESTSLKLPSEATLAPGQKYYLWVTAYLTRDKTIKSPPLAFEVSPP